MEKLKVACGVQEDFFRSEVRNGVRGVFASKDIPAGTVLFTHSVSIKPDNVIPPLAYLSKAMSFQSVLEITFSRAKYDPPSDIIKHKIQAISEFSKAYPEHVDSFLGTTFCLVIEDVYYKKYKYSHYSEYLDWLPPYSQGLCRVSLKDIAHLKGSSLYLEVTEFQKFSRKTFEEVFNGQKIPSFFKFLEAAGIPATDAWRLFNDKASVVQAYSFSLEVADGGKNLMIPLMDALNADENKKNVLLFDSLDAPMINLEAIAQCDIKEGSQLFNSFGEMTASERLIKYGYIDPLDTHSTSFHLNNVFDIVYDGLFTLDHQDLKDMVVNKNIDQYLSDRLGYSGETNLRGFFSELLSERILILRSLKSQHILTGHEEACINGELILCEDFFNVISNRANRSSDEISQ